ncbi:unnamed protein product [Boreogadus saida]
MNKRERGHVSVVEGLPQREAMGAWWRGCLRERPYVVVVEEMVVMVMVVGVVVEVVMEVVLVVVIVVEMVVVMEKVVVVEGWLGRQVDYEGGGCTPHRGVSLSDAGVSVVSGFT